MTVNRKKIPFQKGEMMDLGNYRLIKPFFSPWENYGGYSQKRYFQIRERQEHDQEQSAWIYPLTNHAWLI